MPSQPLSPSVPVIAVNTAPGGVIVLRGSYTSSAHALVIDGCQSGTEAGVQAGQPGLFDYARGGWRLVSRDWDSHTCRLVATGDPAPVCTESGIQGACLPSRLRQIALQQTVPTTVSEMQQALVGGIQMEVLTPTESAAVVPTPPSWLQRNAVGLGAASITTVLTAVVFRTWMKRRAQPESVVARTASRVRARLLKADPVYQRLAPTVVELAAQAGELARLRDRLRARLVDADRPGLERRRVELDARAASSSEAAQARALVDEQLRRVDRWRDEADRAQGRLDRVLEYLRTLDKRLDDALEHRGEMRVRIDDDARLLDEIEQDVEAALAGAREADQVTAHR